MTKIIERIVESDGSPNQKNDLWIHDTGEGPVLKHFSGDKWKPILGGGGGDVSDAVKFIPQDLTETQKEQVRENIGLDAVAYMGDIVGTVN